MSTTDERTDNLQYCCVARSSYMYKFWFGNFTCKSAIVFCRL